MVTALQRTKGRRLDLLVSYWLSRRLTPDDYDVSNPHHATDITVALHGDAASGQFFHSFLLDMRTQ